MRHPHHHYDRSECPQVTGQLFRDVQAASLFSDYKTFVDADPTTEPAEIRERYRAARDGPAVDLNALLYDVETKLVDWIGDASYETAAEQRRGAIETFCWNADAGMYADYRWTDDVVETPTLAGELPLYTGVASDHRATQVAETLRDDYLEDGGLVTTQTETGKMGLAARLGPSPVDGHPRARGVRAHRSRP